MGLAEDLLSMTSDFAPTHTHTVTDPDDYFIIDPDTRVISNAASTRNTIMQYDHNSERYTFELPRYIEGHDMLLCNRVRIHFNNVDGKTNAENADVDEMHDLQINPENEDTVISSWLISRYATQLAGTLNFLVQYLCIDDNGDVVYEWHTDIYTEVDVKPGRNNGEQTVIQYSSILEEWYQRLFGAGDSVMADITALGAEQKAMLQSEAATQKAAIELKGTEVINEAAAQKEAIELKGAEVLATIPADYTETYRMAEDALRKKANAIILDTEGEVIHVADSADTYLLGLNLYGKTTQVTTTGKQLANNTGTSYTTGGITFTSNPDGSITIVGTSTSEAYYLFDFRNDIPIKNTELIASLSGSSNVSMVVGYFTGADTFVNEITTVNSTVTKTFSYPEEAVATRTFLAVSTGKTLNATVYPLVRLATIEDSTYEPYTGGIAAPNPDWPQELVNIENPTVDIWGKNLFDASALSSTLEATAVAENDAITVTTTDENTLSRAIYKVDYPLNTPLTLSFDATILQADTTSSGGTVRLRKGSNSKGIIMLDMTAIGVKKHYEIAIDEGVPEEGYELWLYLRTTAAAAGTISVRFEKIQIEVGSAATAYDTHKDAQSLALTYPLRAIPVTANGNYVDSNGQNWICDEIDFERGVYIQRTNTETINDFEAETNDYGTRYVKYGLSMLPHQECTMCWCPSLPYSANVGLSGPYTENGIRLSPAFRWGTVVAKWEDKVIDSLTVTYALATPIETPLTDEELTKFKMVRTHYHNTTVANDKGAHMAIKYSADTKLYLKNEAHTILSEVLEAIENGTY